MKLKRSTGNSENSCGSLLFHFSTHEATVFRFFRKIYILLNVSLPMGNKNNDVTIDLNKDPVMSFIINKLGVEAIFWALFLHLLVIIYVGYTGNLFELSVPAEIDAIIDASKLTVITPPEDPIFITGIIIVVAVGYMWLRLSSDLPKSLRNLKKNDIIKRKKIVKRKEREGIVIFRKLFVFLDNLYTSKVILRKMKKRGKELDDYEIFLARFEYVLNTKLSYLFALGGVIFFLYIVYLYTMKAPIEESLTLVWIDYRFFPMNTIIYETVWVICYFVIALMIWKLLQIAIYIKRLFDEFEIDIRPFHPDRVGGLRPITQIVMDINLLVFAAGISFAIVYFSYLKTLIPNIWGIIAAYVAISIFLFFYPLMGARESMKINKERFLELFSRPLNREYEMIFLEFKDGIDSYDKHLDEKHLAKVTTLRDFYDRALNMPVWPFDRDSILAFVSRVLFPVLLILVSVILERYI